VFPSLRIWIFSDTAIFSSGKKIAFVPCNDHTEKFLSNKNSEALLKETSLFLQQNNLNYSAPSSLVASAAGASSVASASTAGASSVTSSSTTSSATGAFLAAIAAALSSFFLSFCC